MDRRFFQFVAAAIAIVALNVVLASWFGPRKPPEDKPVAAKKDGDAKKPADNKATAKAADDKTTADKSGAQADVKAASKKELPAEQNHPRKVVTLGSADAKSPYRMLVTLTSEGAAVARVELNSGSYLELDDRSGYLGHVVLPGASSKGGCVVDVVGPGTPAATGGLLPGDVITQIDGKQVISARLLEELLHGYRPKQKVRLTIKRNDRTIELEPITLARRPLEVIRPEIEADGKADPLSYLLTLHQVDDEKLTGEEKFVDPKRELAGVTLRNGNWEIAEHADDRVVFRRTVGAYGLELTKTYKLEKLAADAAADPDAPAYHLTLAIGLRNVGDKAREVAYQFDGPTGLPTEGYWYANKVGFNWSAAGLRDLVVSFDHADPKMIECPTIGEDKFGPAWQGQTVTYIGVDAQYFAAMILPQNESPKDLWFAQSQPLRVGKNNTEWPRLTNISCRLVTRERKLEPGASLTHEYKLFAGPKKPALLDKYGLGSVVYYGWFGWIAIPMLQLLHGFYAIFRNYGIAIVLLTIVVRLAMFPLSRKQALGAQTMAKIQPELKKLQEKYKNNLEARSKAQQELFRKYNYHPLSGCLPVFIQLPIFVALYKALMVDVELRQAPLISQSVNWCWNLAAPDMLFSWYSFMPTFITESPGMFGLGPYFNILPLVTIALFLWQQQKMLPPPTDEQSAMQQKIMKFMMVFMGIMFYKVAAGLCIYFIASSLWGMGERKFLPKLVHEHGDTSAPAPRVERPQPPRKPNRSR